MASTSDAEEQEPVRHGVPASVRYIVWAHLTDSKAKRIDNVYYKLTQRERVPAAASRSMTYAMGVAIARGA